jgi:ATP-dependent Clp protease adaptor protein ClpS
VRRDNHYIMRTHPVRAAEVSANSFWLCTGELCRDSRSNCYARREVSDSIWEGMATRLREGTLLEAKKSKLKPPPLFKVMLLNDDYTPMEFVVVVLQKFFALSREKATQIMLKVHREGMGVCGVYPKDIATTKVEQVVSYARKHKHPLQCVMEET